jgi:hypothetical protein
MMKRKEDRMISPRLVFYGYTEEYLQRDSIERDWLRGLIVMELKKDSHSIHGQDS